MHPKRVPSVAKKNARFSRATSIVEARSKLCLFVRRDVRSRFGEYYTRDTPRQALCQSYVSSAWNTKRRLLPTSARLGRPASTKRVRRGRLHCWHTRRAVPASRRRSQPPPYTRASHPFPESGQSARASRRPSHCGGGTAPELRFSTFLSPGG